MAAKVTDLRSALKMLEDMPGQLIETDVEVEPMAELPVYIVMSERAELLCVRQKKDRQ